MESSDALAWRPSTAIRYYRETRVASSLLQRVPVIHFSRRECVPQLPASRACFRKEIKCVDEECEFTRDFNVEKRKNESISF